MWTDYITSVSHVLKVNEYGERQAKGNEKNLCFKGWETLVNNLLYNKEIYLFYGHPNSIRYNYKQ